MVGKLAKPLGHEPPGDGPCNKVGDEDQFQEVFVEQFDDIIFGCPQHFAHTDFFGTLVGYKICESYKSQASDKDGQNRKYDKEYRNSFFRLMLTFEVFIEKGMFKGCIGCVLFPE